MDSDGQLAQAQLRCRFLKTMKAAENEKSRHPYDCFPPLVFLQALQNAHAHAERDVFSASAELALNPGEKQEIVFLAGLSYDGEKEIATCASGMKAFECISDAWKGVLPDFPQEQDESLRWEMIWNTYVLECMATYHRYFDETFIPQGSVYAFRLGQNASQRDHMQHLLPEIRLNPALAKSCLRFVMEHMSEDGRIIRQDMPDFLLERKKKLLLLLWDKLIAPEKLGARTRESLCSRKTAAEARTAGCGLPIRASC